MENIETKTEQWHHIITVDELDGLNRKVNVVYDAEGVNMAIEKAIDIATKQSSVKGYRPGKAPRKLVINTFKNEINETAKKLLTQEGILHACYEQKLVPLTTPRPEDMKIHDDGTFSCSVFMEVKPTINPTGYIGLSLKKQALDVEFFKSQMLRDLLENNAVNEAKSVVEDGCSVLADYWILLENTEINSGKDFNFTVSLNSEPPFGANLIGAKVSEIATAKIILSEDYKENAGKEAEVKIDVKSIIKKSLLTEDGLASKLGIESAEKMMESIRINAELYAQQRTRASLEEQVTDILTSVNTFEVPTQWVEDEMQYVTKQLGIQQIDANIQAIVYEMAVRNVKRTFILDAIYDAEKHLELTQQDVDNVLQSEAQAINVDVNELKQKMNDRKFFDAMMGAIKNQKVMDFILSTASIEEEAAHSCCGGCHNDCTDNCECNTKKEGE